MFLVGMATDTALKNLHSYAETVINLTWTFGLFNCTSFLAC